MPIVPYRGVEPRIESGVFVAPTAWLVGDVVAGPDCSFWFNSAARGDVHKIRIGARTNVQDGAVLHVSHRTHDLEIGDGVVIGHAAVLHGCFVADGALVGIGARVLDGAKVGAGAQIGAGALVSPGTRIPPGTLALGMPAKPVRDLRPEETRNIRVIVDRYVDLKERYRQESWT
ncbi:MAG: gamma carbonic anhydrase family protein [bacterium]|nr:gamma carbonic anhydrase family protein [bacterium]